MGNHTPGPWHIRECLITRSGDDRTMRLCDILAGDTTIICDVDPECGKQPGNARLIAAAPELLEALEALIIDVAWQDGAYTIGPISDKAGNRIDAARAAIAKALGK